MEAGQLLIIKMRFLVTILFFLLYGCAFQPYYPDYKYTEIVISSPQIPQGVRAYVDNNEAKILSHKDGVLKIRVPRTKEAKILYLRRPGFKEIKVRLTPQKTDEKWAEDRLGITKDRNISANFLSFPTNTAVSVGMIIFTVGLTVHSVFYDSPLKEYSILLPLMCAASALSLPIYMAGDAYNMTIGVASVNLINPKYNYRVEDVEF